MRICGIWIWKIYCLWNRQNICSISRQLHHWLDSVCLAAKVIYWILLRRFCQCILDMLCQLGTGKWNNLGQTINISKLQTRLTPLPNMSIHFHQCTVGCLPINSPQKKNTTLPLKAILRCHPARICKVLRFANVFQPWPNRGRCVLRHGSQPFWRSEEQRNLSWLGLWTVFPWRKARCLSVIESNQKDSLAGWPKAEI